MAAEAWFLVQTMNPIIMYMLAGYWRRRERFALADLCLAVSILGWMNLLGRVLHG